MDALVSGPRSAADVVAKTLGKYKLFLQHPYPYTTMLNYRNPQYLGIDGESFPFSAILPPPANESMLDSGLELSKQVDCTSGTGDGQLDPWQVLDSLPTNAGLKEADTDERITTQLHR